MFNFRGVTSDRSIGDQFISLPAVQYGKLHYRRLETDKNTALKLAKGNYHTTMCLSPAAKADLIWWADNVLESSNPISPEKIDIEISCDASKKGFGAVCNKVPTQGLWTTEVQSKHINELELLAVKFAPKVFEPQLSEKHVKIFSDNTTAVSYITPKEELSLRPVMISLVKFGHGALKTKLGLLLHTSLVSKIRMQTGRVEFLMNAQNGS